ncbi:Os11g0571600 [Oryza sativa Japonica Group]|uniref:Os11g0571600 protein n=2 Tax=Oryza sativa subsp. japonica TaxID=39947 RepID=B9F5G5_ORYSJ|nr:hypothetical protein OsJ_06549 [Oryza sativa Japonica Group]BAT14528.1 Os11g0571600 [Oryza sativa Japonica Group]
MLPATSANPAGMPSTPSCRAVFIATSSLTTPKKEVTLPTRQALYSLPPRRGRPGGLDTTVLICSRDDSNNNYGKATEDSSNGCDESMKKDIRTHLRPRHTHKPPYIQQRMPR